MSSRPVEVGRHVDRLGRVVLLCVILGSRVLLIHRVHVRMAIVHVLIKVRVDLRRRGPARIGATMRTVGTLRVARVMHWAL